MDDNDWNKLDELDKDLLVINNKEYSENTCCLLPRKINTNLNSLKAKGVYYNNKNNNWYSAIDIKGKRTYIGSFTTYREAEIAYISHKKIELQRDIDLYKNRLNDKIIKRLTQIKTTLEEYKGELYGSNR